MKWFFALHLPVGSPSVDLAGDCIPFSKVDYTSLILGFQFIVICLGCTKDRAFFFKGAAGRKKAGRFFPPPTRKFIGHCQLGEFLYEPTGVLGKMSKFLFASSKVSHRKRHEDSVLHHQLALPLRDRVWN